MALRLALLVASAFVACLPLASASFGPLCNTAASRFCCEGVCGRATRSSRGVKRRNSPSRRNRRFSSHRPFRSRPVPSPPGYVLDTPVYRLATNGPTYVTNSNSNVRQTLAKVFSSTN